MKWRWQQTANRGLASTDALVGPSASGVHEVFHLLADPLVFSVVRTEMGEQLLQGPMVRWPVEHRELHANRSGSGLEIPVLGEVRVALVLAARHRPGHLDAAGREQLIDQDDATVTVAIPEPARQELASS